MNRIINIISLRIKRLYNKWVGNNVRGISLLRRFYSFEIVGVNNTIDVRSRLPKDVRIFIYGNNHRLVIEEGVTFKQGKVWFEDHDCEIRIGAGTTIEEAELSVAENGTKIIIGKSGQRINTAKDIEIQNHVWLGYNVNINKGVIIEENSVVAGHSVVTKSVPSNSIVAGLPAKVVKTGITWSRQGSKYYHLNI